MFPNLVGARLSVAPYVGAWIETDNGSLPETVPTSHPTWVRGLKHVDLYSIKTHKKSHPTWVRGLKQRD